MMIESRRRLLLLLGIVLGLASGLAGCGKSSDVKTVGVAGTVYFDGQPAEGIEVHFLAAKHAGFGRSNADGTYELVQGAVPGENQVYFRPKTPPDFSGNPESGMDRGQYEAIMDATPPQHRRAVKLPQSSFPADLCDPAKSQVTFNVPENGTRSADFRLSSK